MPFPTTQMSGYTDLRDRIVLALGRCQEQPWLDFKESQPWPEIRWRLLKTIMAMANLRDGGLIIVGVAERNNAWELTGIDASHLESFDYDDIIDQLNKYASPQVSVDILVHDHDNGNRYLVLHVHQFNESPIVCRGNSPDGVNPKDRLTAGSVYVRPTSGKPQTARVTDASSLHDLLDLAAQFRARRMLETATRVGLGPTENATSRFEAELGTIDKLPVPVTKYPFWRVRFRPSDYNPELIPSLTDCIRLVEKARVQLRGWDFPHLSHTPEDRQQGSSWVGSFVEFAGNIEYWRLYQSGQFVHLAALREASESGWHEKLKKETMAQLRFLKHIDWSSVLGYVNLVNLVYTVTEVFEFAARICQAGVYRGDLDIGIELNGVEGYLLTADFNRAWRQYCPATVGQLSKTWRAPSDGLIAGSADYSLKAIIWLCECFGWMSPNVEAIRTDQQRLLSGRF